MVPSRTPAHIEDFTSKAITDGTANLCPYHCHGCRGSNQSHPPIHHRESYEGCMGHTRDITKYLEHAVCGIDYSLNLYISRRPHYDTDRKFKDNIFMLEPEMRTKDATEFLQPTAGRKNQSNVILKRGLCSPSVSI